MGYVDIMNNINIEYSHVYALKWKVMTMSKVQPADNTFSFSLKKQIKALYVTDKLKTYMVIKCNTKLKSLIFCTHGTIKKDKRIKPAEKPR